MIEILVRGGIDDLIQFFRELPPKVQRIAVQEVTEYLIGDERRGLKHLVPYKYVSRKAAYGKTFVSDKQRRYVMAGIRSGSIKPGQNNRTGTTSAGWGYSTSSGGYSAQIYNSTLGAKYTMGDETQARQPAKVGHRTVSEVLKTNIDGAILRARQAIQRWIDGRV